MRRIQRVTIGIRSKTSKQIRIFAVVDFPFPLRALPIHLECFMLVGFKLCGSDGIHFAEMVDDIIESYASLTGQVLRHSDVNYKVAHTTDGAESSENLLSSFVLKFPLFVTSEYLLISARVAVSPPFFDHLFPKFAPEMPRHHFAEAGAPGSLSNEVYFQLEIWRWHILNSKRVFSVSRIDKAIRKRLRAEVPVNTQIPRISIVDFRPGP